MPASVPLKSLSPHVVVGLSCTFLAGGGLEKLVKRHFSPLPPDKPDVYPHQDLDSSPTRLIIHLAESAFIDSLQARKMPAGSLSSHLNEIPRNTAVFLALTDEWAGSTDLSRSLREHFSTTTGADLTIMVSTDAAWIVSEALSWLDRGECEFAMVLACELVNSQPCGAAVLIAGAASASRDTMRVYACIEKHDKSSALVHPGSAGILPASATVSVSSSQFDYGAIAFIEVCSKDWLESFEPSRHWQHIRQISKQVADNPDRKNQIWSKHDELCYVSSLSLELSGGSPRLAPVFALVNSALALYLRVIPGASQCQLQLDKSSKMVQCKTPRPWIHPVSPVEPAHPRLSFVNLGDDAYLLSEQGDDINTISLRSLQEQSSELFVFFGKTRIELKENLARCATAFILQNYVALAELAYLQNCASGDAGDFKLALVAGSHEELQRLMQEAILHLELSPDAPLKCIGIRAEDQSQSQSRQAFQSRNPTQIQGVAAALKKQILSQSTGIYYAGVAATKPGRIVFVFPGLGAAYPQMLADLCFYFPEVRQVFDFVERLALKADDKVVPSRAVFPASDGSQSSSQAMLATMDSSVVTLLLAEWAIYALLKKLGVLPDVLLGCSTGEFAALTISEAVNIFESAEIFYKLSTHVSRSIPLSQLSELRSVRVAASYEKDILPLLAKMQQTVYVGADLSESCVLLSGQKAAIEELCKLLRQKGIDYLTLPVAIPYHTPLVSGKISESDIQLLNMGAPKVEAWSCSTEGKLPDDSAMLRKISTDLFEKPIRLRSTIQRLYDANARIFVEVGPKGGLVPFISEILSGKEHLAVAANLPGKSGIDQFNALLAVLICHGVEMNLESLYQRRVANYPGQRQESLNSSVKFDDWVQGSDNTEEQISNLLAGGLELISDAGLSDDVMLSYLSTMQQFHASLMGTQERLLMEYLLGAEENSADDFESMRTQVNFAFLPNAALESHEDYYSIQFCLSTAQHPFLLDHAIGGNVSTYSESSKVCLVPLMVALEIMAEGASLVFPHLSVAKLSDIRAYKRIRCKSHNLRLNLELRAFKDNCIDARICFKDVAKDESVLLASCLVEFALDLPESPLPANVPLQESRASRLSPHNLYGEGSMFHGPAMQSVESIDCVSKRSIEGQISCRHADNWFASMPEETGNLILNPLLLDNASQFVLYQMYEYEMPVTALLPFHLGSIEFFQGYQHLLGDKVSASAYLRSMSLRGTEAQIQLCNPEGLVVARVNDISSRAIVLPVNFREFITDPTQSLCRQVEMDGAPEAVIAAISKADMPEDETALDWTTDYFLTDAEQSEWRQVGRTKKRRLDWLMGRIAAKDAVRWFLKQEFGLALKPVDIEIRRAESGYAEASLANVDIPWTPQVSISHCNKIAVAIAEPPRNDRLAGIDVEDIIERDEGFAELSFTQNELNWINAKPNSVRSLQIARLWTAKEAVAKACGSGLSGNPKLFELLVNEGLENKFRIIAKMNGQARAGVYNCLVSTDNIDCVSLAIVMGSRESGRP